MKIALIINGTEHVLTFEEAKRIHAELDKVFGKAPVVIEKRVSEPYPIYWHPSPPFHNIPSIPFPYDGPMCDDTTNFSVDARASA